MTSRVNLLNLWHSTVSGAKTTHKDNNERISPRRASPSTLVLNRWCIEPQPARRRISSKAKVKCNWRRGKNRQHFQWAPNVLFGKFPVALNVLALASPSKSCQCLLVCGGAHFVCPARRTRSRFTSFILRYFLRRFVSFGSWPKELGIL